MMPIHFCVLPVTCNACCRKLCSQYIPPNHVFLDVHVYILNLVLFTVQTGFAAVADTFGSLTVELQKELVCIIHVCEIYTL